MYTENLKQIHTSKHTGEIIALYFFMLRFTLKTIFIFSPVCISLFCELCHSVMRKSYCSFCLNQESQESNRANIQLKIMEVVFERLTELGANFTIEIF